MADDNQTPVFQIQRMYLKDLSLEQPNSPQILLEQSQPAVDIQLGLGAEAIADGVYEVAVTATVTTKVADKVLFLVEAKQAGIFEIRNIPAEQVDQIIGHRLPGHRLPVPARHRLRLCCACRLPAGAAGRGELPGHVRGAARPGRGGRTARASSPASTETRDPARMNLTVLGAGAWGTALAVSACTRQPTRLWVRDAAQAQAMRSERRNQRYLSDIALPPALQVDTDFDAAVAHARGGLLVVATPMAGLEGILRRLPADAPGVLWLCKGFQEGTGRLGHEIARAVCPSLRAGVLSGPSFAIEVARGQPTAVVAASHDAALAERAVDAFHSDTLRIYTSSDPWAWRVGGAVKNVMAIATGIADGMQLGLNARAALVTVAAWPR